MPFVPQIAKIFSMNIPEIVKIVLRSLFTLLRSTDNQLSDKIKFIGLEKEIQSVKFKAFVEFETVSIPKTKVIEPQSMTKKATVKKAQPVKLSFDPDYAEKPVACPSINENMAIIQSNDVFEKAYQINIVDCLNKLFKVEPDRDSFVGGFRQFYDEIKPVFVKEICCEMHLERFVYLIEPQRTNTLSSNN